ncbi:ribokinase [Niveomyces insectorum RCEF 264]|uniref:Ribokinase n=1 Tax=Niveomyces insectorum RCEF 264 TaxID=1081102 RepID=A0A168A850_9HYPO|nr:ribokinase [Niveomyces insectorum RCEF 264]
MASDTSAAAVGGRLPCITVLGSLNRDLVSYVAHYPEPGETITSTGLARSLGGKGANQAVACAKLSRSKPAAASSESATADDVTAAASAHVNMIGAVGADADGTALRENLARYGVDVSGVAVLPGETTGLAVIVVDESTGQNRIIFTPGANFALAKHAASLSSSALIPAGTQLLILQLEVPLALVVRALAEARAAGVPVLLNPAPAPADDAARAQLEAAFAVVPSSSSSPDAKGLSHLVLNETETAALVPGLAAEDLTTKTTTTTTNNGTEALARAARYFFDRGVENVVITLGGHGVYYAARSNSNNNNGGGVLVPPEPVKQVVDTTGAGDTFAGQYALEVVYAAAAGRAFDGVAAVRKANRVAAKTVQRKGAQDSIPWRDEVE